MRRGRRRSGNVESCYKWGIVCNLQNDDRAIFTSVLYHFYYCIRSTIAVPLCTISGVFVTSLLNLLPLPRQPPQPQSIDKCGLLRGLRLRCTTICTCRFYSNQPLMEYGRYLFFTNIEWDCSCSSHPYILPHTPPASRGTTRSLRHTMMNAVW